MNQDIQEKHHRPLDLICMGRIAVDYYSQQIGSRLEDASTFSMYLGGSSGNVAYGTALQGLKSSMLARVGDEHMGRFIRESLQRVGVDTSHLITDKEHLTALVILGIKDQETFPLIFYRDNCADMAITKDDVSEAFIASSRCLAITGTHLSHPQTREAVLTALHYARKNNTKTALDIDYRPVLWGLTSLGDGETRFIESSKITEQLQEVLHLFDLIVGTEEEIHIAGGSTDTIQALKTIRAVSDATIVCKRGAMGCSVFESAIPDTLDEGLTIYGVHVDVLNVLGAGDAFMSGLLRGYLNNEGFKKACMYANACGALVVSRHGCAPAMPTKVELDNYLMRAKDIPRPDIDPYLNHLHRVTTRKYSNWSNLAILAFDHRVQFTDLIREYQASDQQISQIKILIMQSFEMAQSELPESMQSGILCDSTYGQATLNRATGKHFNSKPLWIARPIELPASRPLKLEHGNIGSQLVKCPIEQIIKCLVFYHPNDSIELRLAQELVLKEVYDACCQSGHQLLIEVILPQNETLDLNEDYYNATIKRLYHLGIKPDWWKLPPLQSAQWRLITQTIKQEDPYCLGIVILGLDMPIEALSDLLSQSAGYPLVKGFAIGRSIWCDPVKKLLSKQIDDNQFITSVKNNYLFFANLWLKR